MRLVLEFGSRQHGSFDAYSDKDLMLIYSCRKKLADEKKAYKEAGYSVSTCSLDRAMYLSMSGSLFIRHVMYEGKLVHGNVGLAKSLQSLWEPANNYDKEIQCNQEMLSILEAIPRTKTAKSVVNDILICSIRNILIRQLANEGIYVFSWGDVIRESVIRGLVKQNEVKALLLSRKLKNIYRFGIIPDIPDHLMEILEDITQRVIDKKRKVRMGKHKEVTSLPDIQHGGSYAQLRAIELLCAHYNFDQSMSKYRLATKDPSYFCNLGPNKAINRNAA